MEDTYICDLQFFRGDCNKELILKCLTFTKLYSDTIEQFIFKPPFPFHQLSPYRRHEAQYLTKNVHHIDWDDGFIEYNQIKKIIINIFHKAKEIMVKGHEKATFLNSVLEKKICYNMELINCPNLKSLKSKLSGFPLENFSTLNVKVLKSWLKMIFQHSSEYINNAIDKFSRDGLFSLCDSDIYFLPVSLLLKHCPPELLRSYYVKFPPHIVNDELFQQCINS